MAQGREPGKPGGLRVQYLQNAEKDSWLTKEWEDQTGVNRKPRKADKGHLTALLNPQLLAPPLEECLMSRKLLRCSEVSLATGLFSHYILPALCVNPQNGLNVVRGEQKQGSYILATATDSAKAGSTWTHRNYTFCHENK